MENSFYLIYFFIFQLFIYYKLILNANSNSHLEWDRMQIVVAGNVCDMTVYQ